MSKKKTAPEAPNFDGLIGGEIPKPIVEGKNSTSKLKKKKVGPKVITPEDWVKTMVKMDPKIKKKLKQKVSASDNLTISTIIDAAVREYLKSK